MIRVVYIDKNEICGASFRNKEKVVNVNREDIIEVTEPVEFRLPFSRNYVGDYFVVKTGQDAYFCKKEQFEKIKEQIDNSKEIRIIGPKIDINLSGGFIAEFNTKKGNFFLYTNIPIEFRKELSDWIENKLGV